MAITPAIKDAPRHTKELLLGLCLIDKKNEGKYIGTFSGSI